MEKMHFKHQTCNTRLYCMLFFFILIQKFYQKGNTHPMIKKIVCPLLEDALNTLMESKDAILHDVSGKSDAANTRYGSMICHNL